MHLKNTVKKIVRTNDEIERIYHEYNNMIYRICFAYMKNVPEAEDMVSDTFVQLIKKAPYFENAQLLIAADCTAYAYAGFHEKFMKDHVTLIGCPKLDEGDYADKLAEIIGNNSIRSIRIVRMEVPCCGGIENAVIRAMERSGKMIPWQVVTIACDGTIREEL